MNPNISWLYQKDYFQNLLRDRAEVEENRRQHIVTDLNWSFVTQGNNEEQRARNAALLAKKNKRITRSVFRTEETEPLILGSSISGKPVSHLDLTTTYPGLALGTGMQHEAHIEGEYKLGFYFDPTTGLPVLPGSSIKGVLRSIFPSTKRSHQDKPKEGATERVSFLTEMVNTTPALRAFKGLDANQWEALEMDIFEGLRKPSGKMENTPQALEGPAIQPHEKGYSIHVPNAKRDCWHDAYILKTANEGNRYLDSDYITPHLNRDIPALSPFTNPTPLQFLKILPRVTFRFQFVLHDSDVLGKVIKAADKLALFKEILYTQGVGAKTNVGYGQFEQPIPAPTITYTDPGPGGRSPQPPPPTPKTDLPPLVTYAQLNAGNNNKVVGKIVKMEGRKATVELRVKDQAPPAEITFRNDSYEVGKAYIFTISAVQGNGDKRKVVLGYANPTAVG